MTGTPEHPLKLLVSEYHLRVYRPQIAQDVYDNLDGRASGTYLWSVKFSLELILNTLDVSPLSEVCLY